MKDRINEEVSLNLLMPKALRDKIDAEAKKQQRSRSGIVRVIISEYFEKKEKGGKKNG